MSTLTIAALRPHNSGATPMVDRPVNPHDGTMTEHSSADADGFDPGRIRTIGEMRRTSDDHMVAGVCAGIARHLNIDPVVVRIVIACLAFAGGAGVIVYIAAWLLIPEDGEEQGILDRHFSANADVEQIRKVGLFAAAAIAAAAALGSGWAMGPAGVPIVLVALGLFYVFAIRPYNRRQAERLAVSPEGAARVSATGTPIDTTVESGDGAPPIAADGTGHTPRPRNPRRDRGALFALTMAVVAVVIGAMWIYSAAVETIAWPYFALAALFVIAAGMLTGAYYGNGRHLAWLGIPLAAVLLATSALPSYTFGDASRHPAYAADVHDEYAQGIGNFVLDLSDVSDLSELDERTIDIEQGIGRLEVIVPDGLNVEVDAKTDAGELKIFDRTTDGAPVSMHHVDPPDADPSLNLDIKQNVGEVRVSRS